MGASEDVINALKRDQIAKIASLIASIKPRRKTEVFWLSESVCSITCTRGVLAIVDADDLPKVLQHKWAANVKLNGVYAQARINGRSVMLHRFVFGQEIPKRFVIDHRDGDTLDCRKSNLRLATKSQNGANAKPQKRASSRFKGVVWNPTNRKWIAQIAPERRNKYLGSFSSEQEAALRYDESARELFGEFAKTNF